MERQALTQQDPDLPEDFRLYGSAGEGTPWKAIYLAVGLLIAGTILLLTGVGLWATDPKAHGMTFGCVCSKRCTSPSQAVSADVCRICAVHTWTCHFHPWLLLFAHSLLCPQRPPRLLV